MPYISDKIRRIALRVDGSPAFNAGELNYQIFHYVKHYCIGGVCAVATHRAQIKEYVRDFLGDKPNYQRYNDMTGCLVRCGKEIDRRFDIKWLLLLLLNIMESYDEEIAKYEEKKILENGDVE